MERVISIIGRSGGLAQSLRNRLSKNNNVRCHGKDVVDFNDSISIVNFTPQLLDSDVIIVCSGNLSENINRNMKINALGPIHLINELVGHGAKAHVVVIGSHASTWISWPGITMDRLSYNVAKKCLKDFITGLEHSELTNMKLTIYNVSKFQSPMSDYTGIPMDDVVNNIIWIIDQPNPPLIFENGKSK